MRGDATRGGVRARRGEDSRMGGCLNELNGKYRFIRARFGRWMDARGGMGDTDERVMCFDVIRRNSGTSLRSVGWIHLG